MDTETLKAPVNLYWRIKSEDVNASRDPTKQIVSDQISFGNLGFFFRMQFCSEPEEVTVKIGVKNTTEQDVLMRCRLEATTESGNKSSCNFTERFGEKGKKGARIFPRGMQDEWVDIKMVGDIEYQVQRTGFETIDKDGLGKDLFEKEDTKDGTLIADGKGMKVHKNVIACYSQVLQDKFNQNDQVELSGFDFETVKIAIKFIYRLPLNDSLQFTQKLKMLTFFGKFGMEKFKGPLESYLVTVINELTICKIYAAAKEANSQTLMMACEKRLQKLINEKKNLADLELLGAESRESYLPKSKTHKINA